MTEALGPGEVAGVEIAEGGTQLQITQTDKRGYSYAWMQMAPGDRVIIRDAEESGFHQMIVTDRHSEGDQVIIDYQTVETSGTTVGGKTVEVIALGP